MKILWKRGEIAPKEQFLLFSAIFCRLLVDLCVKTGTRFSLRDKRLFEISEFEITRVDCIYVFYYDFSFYLFHMQDYMWETVRQVGHMWRLLISFAPCHYIIWKEQAYEKNDTNSHLHHVGRSCSKFG